MNPLHVIFYLALGIFLLLTGIAAVTNIEIVWMAAVAGVAALVAGVLALVIAFKG